MCPGSTQIESAYLPAGVTSLLVVTTRHGAISCKRPSISIPSAGPSLTYSKSDNSSPVHSDTLFRTSSSVSPIPKTPSHIPADSGSASER